METAPLTLAHDHARAASVATHNAETTVAVDEHALAAGEFAKAATTTGSQEALRTLKLLEQHHQRLSFLLKFPSLNPVPTATATEPEVRLTDEVKVSTSAAVAELRSTKPEPLPSPSTAAKSKTLPRRLPSRDLGSSIASNLASARGIRANNERRALSPSVSTQQAPGNVEMPMRKGSRSSRIEPSIPEHPSGKPSWVPPIHNHQNKADAQVLTTRASASAEPASPPAGPNDEGFFKFYSTFENLISKLSAPLAFAGLPLISEESVEPLPAPESPTTVPRRNPRRTPAKSPGQEAATPDLAKYISRAALRASAHQTPVNDSFYVVPSTGHTVSYAGILAFAEKDKRRLAASMHSENPDLFEDPNEDEEEFVDAREHNISHSAGFKKILQSARGKGGRNAENVLEELYLDNKNMKSTIDQLCKRLHAFEASAQSSSLALQESMRLMRPGSPGKLQPNSNNNNTLTVPTGSMIAPPTVTTAPSAGSSTGAFGPLIVRGSTEDLLLRKIKELEEQNRAGDVERERLARELEKLNKVLAKYKERWEKLKDGAKARREGAANQNAAKAVAGGEGRSTA